MILELCRPAPQAATAGLFHHVRHGLRWLGNSRRRARARAAMMALDDRLLRDIGVSRTEVQRCALGLHRDKAAA